MDVTQTNLFIFNSLVCRFSKSSTHSSTVATNLERALHVSMKFFYFGSLNTSETDKLKVTKFGRIAEFYWWRAAQEYKTKIIRERNACSFGPRPNVCVFAFDFIFMAIGTRQSLGQCKKMRQMKIFNFLSFVCTKSFEDKRDHYQELGLIEVHSARTWNYRIFGVHRALASPRNDIHCGCNNAK